MRIARKLLVIIFFGALLFLPAISRADNGTCLDKKLCQAIPTSSCNANSNCTVSGFSCVMKVPCEGRLTQSSCEIAVVPAVSYCLWSVTVTNDNSGATTVTNNNTDLGANLSLDNPLGSISSPQLLIGRVINSILGVVGSIALIMFIFGGLTWMTSGGSADKIKKGRDIIVWSAIGLVVIFASYGLVRVLILSIR